MQNERLKRLQPPTRPPPMSVWSTCIALEKLGNNVVEKVGGKIASLGEMISQLSDAPVFSTTAYAYKEFLDQGSIKQVH